MRNLPARMPVGYIRDRTALYKEKWDALHPQCVPTKTVIAAAA